MMVLEINILINWVENDDVGEYRDTQHDNDNAKIINIFQPLHVKKDGVTNYNM